MNVTTTLFKNNKKIIQWIISVFFKNRSDFTVLNEWWNSKVTMWLSTRGIADTCKRIKQIQLHVTRYICKQPLLVTEGYPLKVRKDGLPTSLGPILALLEPNNISPENIRFVLTLLSVKRTLNFSTAPDMSPIESSSTASNFLLGEVDDIMSDLGWNLDMPKWRRPHLSTKSGPNGLAMMSATLDSELISDTMRKDLGILGGENFLKYYDRFKSLPLSFINKAFNITGTAKFLRKLAIINDKEGKSRIICLFDYWSQSVLKPLHDNCFKLLRTLKSDRTFNQTKPNEILGKGPYYSLDLKNATDRFPIEFQERVLKHLTNEEYALSWKGIIQSYEVYVPWLNKSTKYRVGQPMGAYSSWSVFALSHHVLVRLAAKQAGKTAHFQKYILLGDDIVIGNKDVAERYQQLLTTLGVSISPAKTHVSKDTYEFAKRWYYQGTEVSGAQVSAFHESKWYILAEEFRNLCSRFHVDPIEWANPGSIKSLLRLSKIERSYRKALKFLYLPREGDSKVHKANKFNQLTALLLKNHLSCNHNRKNQYAFIFETLIEAKAELLGSSITSARKVLTQFDKRMKKIPFPKDSIPGVSDYRLILKALPFYDAINEEVDDIHLQDDILEYNMMTDPDKVYFERVIHFGVNPE